MAALQSGTRVGPYEILALIGAGGMGEVYRSRDTKLKRDVAIKVLPPEFSADPDRVHRFQREAEVLATLNHPHIAQIYGVEEVNGSLCLVLELVEGETLADRLKRSAIPIEDALEIGRQAAEALEAAHDRDIVHRDLKPANIKITPDGKVKVLDFGLAKAIGGDPVDAGASHSPTMVSGTMAGVILGTAAYMSPEQAKGRAADPRSDIWSFGVVLYEMITGKPAFSGENVVEIISGVVRADPDWRALPEHTPPAIRSLLKRCLQKDRNRRLRDIADARFQIEEALAVPAHPHAVAPVRKSRERMLWIAGMLVVVSVMTFLYLRRAPAEAPEIRVQIVTPPGADLTGFALSPDGRKLVFRAATEGKTQLWLRPLDSETAQPIPGTESAGRAGDSVFIFWSSDSRSLGFFTGGQLKRIDLDSGLVRSLAIARGAGGTWNSDGTIVFAPTYSSPLYRVPANGGEVVQVTDIDPPRVTGHFSPQFLPDGRHFLFHAYGPPESRGIYVGSLDSRESHRLIDADSAGVFVPPDYVLFGRKGSLQTQRLDLKTLRPAGDLMLVAPQHAVDLDYIRSAVSGTSAAVAYRPSDVERQLVWFNRAGREIQAVAPPDAALKVLGTEVSPDERTAAVINASSGNLSVWLTEMASGVSRRFSLIPSWHCCPVWSSDGASLLFSSDPKGPASIFEKPVNRAGAETALFELSEDVLPRDWSSDGRFILYRVNSTKTGEDLWVLPSFGDKKPIEVARTAAQEPDGRFSPDGRWIVYQSNETGTTEVWVQPFPGATGKRQITSGGGRIPRWSRDQRELFYIGPDNRLMALPITFSGSSVQTGRPVPLFTLPPDSEYSVARSGQRFLINKVAKDASPITLIFNWNPR